MIFGFMDNLASPRVYRQMRTETAEVNLSGSEFDGLFSKKLELFATAQRIWTRTCEVSMSSSSVDALVVGSGLSALACSRQFARAGLRTVILDQAEAPGGHLLPFVRGNQVFEVGLHYVADCGPESQWQGACQKLGVNLPTDPLDSDFERIVDRQGQLIFQYSADCSLHFSRLQEYFGNSRSWQMLRDDLDLVWKVARRFEFPLQFSQVLKNVLAHEDVGLVACRRLVHLLSTTASDYVRRELGLTGHAAESVLLHHLLIGTHPARLPAFLLLLVQRYYFEGPCFVRGGGRAMIDALLHPDIDLHVRSPVDAIEKLPAGKFRISSQGRSWVASQVVWTPDPRILRSVARFPLPARLRLQLRQARAPHALVVGYFGTRQELSDLGFQNANYWISGSLPSESIYECTELETLAQESTLYLSMGSLRDSGACKPCAGIPNNKAARGVFQAMFLVPPRADLWGASSADLAFPEDTVGQVQSYRLSERQGGYRRHYLLKKSAILSLLKKRLLTAFPGLTEDEFVWSELGTPLTHARYLGSLTYGGYGFESSRKDLLFMRPRWKSGVPGLSLCGAHIRPSHGILTCLLNGVGVAESILSQQGRM